MMGAGRSESPRQHWRAAAGCWAGAERGWRLALLLPALKPPELDYDAVPPSSCSFSSAGRFILHCCGADEAEQDSPACCRAKPGSIRSEEKNMHPSYYLL